MTFYQPGGYDHSVLYTTAQLTEARSARDQPKQPPAKKTPRADELGEGTLGGWDTSLVQHSVDTKNDTAVSKRDYESLLMTARISALEDDQLKLP